MLDEYQILESKSMGADAILLIAALLTITEINSFTNIAHSLGLEVMLETHTNEEVMAHQEAIADVVGINNRNLHNFEVDIENSIKLLQALPKKMVKVAESGIDSADTIRLLKQHGFDGFLIGEYFMRHSHPAEKCKELIKELKG